MVTSSRLSSSMESEEYLPTAKDPTGARQPPSSPPPLLDDVINFPNQNVTSGGGGGTKEPDLVAVVDDEEEEEATTVVSHPSTTTSNSHTEEYDEEDTASTTVDNPSSIAIEFDVGKGVDPNDFDGLYYLLKWIIPLFQVGTWVCVLALPLCNNPTIHLVWLWIVFGVQWLYASYGAFQCYHAITAMNRVKRVCLQYSEKKKNTTKQKSKTEGDSDDSTSTPALAEIPSSSLSISSQEQEEVMAGNETPAIPATLPPPPLLSHVFIIPNYCEPEHVLEETLGYLATHTWAKQNYTVVLACEDAEKDHHVKAERLIHKFQPSFHRILYTSHILQTAVNGESRGKASNESWATRYISKDVRLHPELYSSTVGCCCCGGDTATVESSDHRSSYDDSDNKNDLEKGCCDHTRRQNNFSSSQVMIHVLDADAHVHNAYTLEVEANCRKIIMQQQQQQAKRGKQPRAGTKQDNEDVPAVLSRTIFAPPAIMSRNNMDVPAINRVQDIAWSATAFNNLTSFSKICYPVSNYAFCLKLAEDIDFWDATNETITEEMHFFLKAFFKTSTGSLPSSSSSSSSSSQKLSNKNKTTSTPNGPMVRVQPIYVPINMLNLNTGGSWWSNLKARFIQAERHARAVTEFAYCFRQLIQHPSASTTSLQTFGMKLIATWKTFVAMIFPPVIPFFVGVAAPFCQLLYWIRGPEMFASNPTTYFLLQWTQFFGLVTIVIIGCQLVAYDVATRYANAHLYQRPNMTWKQTLIPLPLVAINLWVYIVIPFALASFRSILPKRFTKKDTFVVSAKQ